MISIKFFAGVILQTVQVSKEEARRVKMGGKHTKA